MYPLKKALVNKASVLASALIALLIITSCSDSGTSTGVTPLSRDAAETGAINNATLKKEADHDHGPQGHESTGVANPGQGEGLGHQHGEPHDFSLRGIVTESVISEKTPTSRDEADAGGPAPKAATKAAPKASSTASTATTATDNPPTTSTDNPPTSQDTPTDTGGGCPILPDDPYQGPLESNCISPGYEFTEYIESEVKAFGRYEDTFVCSADCTDVTLTLSKAFCVDGVVVTVSDGGYANCPISSSSSWYQSSGPAKG